MSKIPVFIPGSVHGALPNGTRIKKVNSEPRDGHSDGDQGTVLASHGPVEAPGLGPELFYFVEWDSHPNVPVGVLGSKIEKLGRTP